jgi:hypothetical protein
MRSSLLIPRSRSNLRSQAPEVLLAALKHGPVKTLRSTDAIFSIAEGILILSDFAAVQ